MGKIYMIRRDEGRCREIRHRVQPGVFSSKTRKEGTGRGFYPQANLTTCFGEDKVNARIGELMMALLEDEDVPEKGEYIRERNGVDYIPSSISLSAADAKLRLEPGTEKLLSEILDPLRGDYDYILIDTCPSLGALNINAMAAADEVIVTVNPQLLAMMDFRIS